MNITIHINICSYESPLVPICVIDYANIPVQGQRGPKRVFPTLRCDAPGGGWRCDAATLRGAGGAATLRRCDAAVGPVTLRRCWRCDAGVTRCDAVGAATLRRWSDAATLSLRRCDAGATLRRCWRCDAATLLALRRFLLQECTWRCVAARHGNPHWRSSELKELNPHWWM